MLREELQSYFDRAYPYSKIDSEHPLKGQIHIRFELGGENKNGTIKRVNQATDRAFTIFNETFKESAHEIFVLIYEYQGANILNTSNDYLYKQFPKDEFVGFYSKFEIINASYIAADENKNLFTEKREVRVVIGKLAIKNIDIKNILNGIANLEMGFDPCINQRIFFFDPITDKAFQMYDDRGCYVWSNNADNIRDIYIKRNDWIVESYRSKINEYFRNDNKNGI